MPPTKRCVVATVLLLVVMGLQPSTPAEARVTAYSSDGDSRTFGGWLPHTWWNALPYPPPNDGLKGFLVDSWTGNAACEPAAAPPPPPSSGGGAGRYIALIGHDRRRAGGCDFVERVLAAQRAGYEAAVVVVRDWNEASVTDDYVDVGRGRGEVDWIQIGIPSVVVNEETADALRLNYTLDKGGRVVLTGPCRVPFEATPAWVGVGCLGLGGVAIALGLVWFGLGLGVHKVFIIPQLVLTGLTQPLILIWVAGLTLLPVHLEFLTLLIILDVLALIFMLFQTKRARTYFSLLLGFGLTVVGLRLTQPHLRGAALMSSWICGLVALVMLGVYPFVFAAVPAFDLRALLGDDDLLRKSPDKKLGGGTTTV